ncbi:hypothetical protein BGZ73_002425 [Actinomortierella ambigua]|nr:hypothetical protein BGZ73_002425 [Actinomortierella ambigua]
MVPPVCSPPTPHEIETLQSLQWFFQDPANVEPLLVGPSKGALAQDVTNPLGPRKLRGRNWTLQSVLMCSDEDRESVFLATQFLWHRFIGGLEQWSSLFSSKAAAGTAGAAAAMDPSHHSIKINWSQIMLQLGCAYPELSRLPAKNIRVMLFRLIEKRAELDALLKRTNVRVIDVPGGVPSSSSSISPSSPSSSATTAATAITTTTAVVAASAPASTSSDEIQWHETRLSTWVMGLSKIKRIKDTVEHIRKTHEQMLRLREHHRSDLKIPRKRSVRSRAKTATTTTTETATAMQETVLDSNVGAAAPSEGSELTHINVLASPTTAAKTTTVAKSAAIAPKAPTASAKAAAEATATGAGSDSLDSDAPSLVHQQSLPLAGTDRGEDKVIGLKLWKNTNRRKREERSQRLRKTKTPTEDTGSSLATDDTATKTTTAATTVTATAEKAASILGVKRPRCDDDTDGDDTDRDTTSKDDKSDENKPGGKQVKEDDAGISQQSPQTPSLPTILSAEAKAVLQKFRPQTRREQVSAVADQKPPSKNDNASNKGKAAFARLKGSNIAGGGNDATGVDLKKGGQLQEQKQEETKVLDTLGMDEPGLQAQKTIQDYLVRLVTAAVEAATVQVEARVQQQVELKTAEAMKAMQEAMARQEEEIGRLTDQVRRLQTQQDFRTHMKLAVESMTTALEIDERFLHTEVLGKTHANRLDQLETNVRRWEACGGNSDGGGRTTADRRKSNQGPNDRRWDLPSPAAGRSLSPSSMTMTVDEGWARSSRGSSQSSSVSDGSSRRGWEGRTAMETNTNSKPSTRLEVEVIVAPRAKAKQEMEGLVDAPARLSRSASKEIASMQPISKRLRSRADA